MSAKRDITLKVRVTQDQKDRWQRATIRARCRDLSSFIRETVDEACEDGEWVSVEFDTQQAKALTEALIKTEVAELADAPASSPGDESREGSTPSLGTTCPRKFTHRSGVYCTACGSTPA